MAYNIKGTAIFEEEGHGAHYYAFSDDLYTTTYSEAFANIVLPTTFQNIPSDGSAQYSRRNGFISLGIYGSGNGVDLGIVNKGNGWMPCYYDTKAYDIYGNHYGAEFSSYMANSSATNAIIVAKPINSSTVGLYVQFLDANGNQVVEFSRNNLPVVSRTWSKYYRFASLVQDLPQTAPDDRTDGTYMLGGSFTNLALYNTTASSYYPWGIWTTSPATLIHDAWIMYYPKCQVSTTNNSDSFSIDHR